ncbi:unnamed protein product [Lactuca virosa]|uniref:Protein kinase domain-containing protein n=1 Tax=Lactuca virosa TaxID=75947 RepID=A0AAU9MLQ2_9ASTR|nr:unnamed protein product [Lactuca virosa]
MDELKKITAKFSSMSIISAGLGIKLYYGLLKSGQVAAITELDCRREQAQDVLALISMVSRLKHENVAGLLGYCVDADWSLLVFEFSLIGSLHDILHGGSNDKGAQPGPVLSWSQRVKIAVGAAKGLQYLHEKTQPPLAHGEMKSSNVMLFEDHVAKIIYIDLKKQTPYMKVISGTTRIYAPSGYHSPEYAMTGVTNLKSDIYCFGVILLELLTGRKPIHLTLPQGQQTLVSWATPRLSEGKVNQYIDARLNGEYPPKAVAKMAAIAASCVQNEAEFRPNISIVVKELRFSSIVLQVDTISFIAPFLDPNIPDKNIVRDVDDDRFPNKLLNLLIRPLYFLQVK